MSREDKRRVEREKRKAEQRTTPVEEEAAEPGAGAGAGTGRPSVGQYVGEVRSELKRVHWPNRKELVSYTIVVIVALALMTAFISGVDAIFSRLVFEVFG